MKTLPIKAAKDFAKQWNQSQVMIVTWDDKDKLIHTLSYGVTHKDCEEAAMGMNIVRKALKFPEGGCNLLPSWVTTDYDRAYAALGLNEPFVPDPTCHHLIQNHRLAGIVAWGLRQMGLEAK
jgi:hypothetical protein